MAPSPALGGQAPPWEPRSWFFIPPALEALQEELSTVGSGTPGPFEPLSAPNGLLLTCPMPLSLTIPHLEKTGAIGQGSLTLSPKISPHTQPSAASPATSGEGPPLQGQSLSQALKPLSHPPPACSRPGCYLAPLSWPPIPRSYLKTYSMALLCQAMAGLQMDPCPLKADFCPTFQVRHLTLRPPGPVATSLSPSCLLLLLCAPSSLFNLLQVGCALWPHPCFAHTLVSPL